MGTTEALARGAPCFPQASFTRVRRASPRPTAEGTQARGGAWGLGRGVRTRTRPLHAQGWVSHAHSSTPAPRQPGQSQPVCDADERCAAGRSERGPWRWAPKAGVPGLGHGDGRGLAGGGPGPQPCLSWAAEGRAACRKLLAGWEWGPLTSSPSPEGRLQRAELSGSKIFNFLSIFLDVAVYKRQILDKPHFALN